MKTVRVTDHVGTMHEWDEASWTVRSDGSLVIWTDVNVAQFASRCWTLVEFVEG